MDVNSFFCHLDTMPQPPSTQQLTELQTLSLLPDRNIGTWPSEARKALQSGLRTTASHPKCISIYWLKKTEDPQTIVIISSINPSNLQSFLVLIFVAEWSESVDFASSRSYLRSLLPYLKSPPPQSIHVNHVPHSFSSYAISNFLTVYFPIRKCSANFKSQIASNVVSFVNSIESTYSNPQCLRFLTSGWINETKMLAGKVVSGFIFCLMWTDKKSEESYKKGNEHWRVLMRFLKTMGMLGEEEFHGKIFQVFGESNRERFEFSDDSSDDSDIDQLDSMRERSNKLAPLCNSRITASGFSGGMIEAPLPERARPNISWLWDTPELSSFPVLQHDVSNGHNDTLSWWEDDTEKAIADDSDLESPDSTPLLTPSSSTMSLSSLFDESKSMSALPGTWKSGYDISRGRDVDKITSISNSCRDSGNGERTQPTSPKCRYRSEYTGYEEDEEADVGIVDPQELTSRLRVVAAENPTTPSRMLVLNLDHDTLRRSTDQKFEKDMSGLGKRGGTKWDPEEELLNAKLRFWGRGKKLPTQMQAQRTKFGPRSPPAERTFSTDRGLTINPLRNARLQDKRKGSWWAYLRECLPKPAAGSTTNAEVKAGADVEMGST